MDTVDIEKKNRNNFKAMMNALSMPGDIHKIEELFNSPLLAIANTLLYSEVSFYYDGDEEFELIEAITNPKKEDASKADYVFCDELNEYLFNKGKVGTSKDPEFSTTYIFKCKDFNGLDILLSGPGIDGTKKVKLPIDKSFVEFFNEKNSYYPLGNEVYFLNEKSEIIAISRTTNLEVL
ncbi:alpha-D-ribose 1-methylphosphonate 5-triphosphate synthase subunit PhnH [Malaciobacter marinus]|jgi:alpha-D-ribose 1-methylphosphonate 5-triphosphate synthase subunit PhnH|uniref:Alpha-D-ribose 1-methylphosphonate 5-triphosphate synthase subunit PhnH n=1 Tax=Malaciobacter marinus TaxID=505249 RepID=A0AB36ZYJ3_9BACT|nr:phosphonate C-P lyase system protein PhnH [Malaciobacter marinus]PPK62625.1 alpha-D-ribose 1-methylphosphonate 5-triphosphate synthase subunit PhnH [Malaciobacter marinus]